MSRLSAIGAPVWQETSVSIFDARDTGMTNPTSPIGRPANAMLIIPGCTSMGTLYD